MANSDILVIGDTHFPFHDLNALRKIEDAVEDIRAGTVIQLGDLYDFYAFSKYPRSLDVLTPADELATGRNAAAKMWANIRSIARRQRRQIRCLQLTGNHDLRAAKRIQEKAPEFEVAVNEWLDSRMTFPGVEVVSDETTLSVPFCGEVMFMHGMRKHGEHARYNQMNTVVGHTHTGGVVYYTNKNGVYWELNAGWVGRKSEPVFGYQAQKRISGTTVGFGLIDSRGPRFVPLE